MPSPDGVRSRDSWSRRTVALGQRHRAVVGVFLVLGLVVGGLTALLRPPTYRAEARLLVGSFEAPAAAIPGYILASQEVAADYARVAGSSKVLDKLPDDGPLAPRQVESMVKVTAVPESAIIRIVATSSGEEDARVAADAMSLAIVGYVDELNTQTLDDDTLEASYREAARRLWTAELAAEDAQRDAAVAAPGSTAQNDYVAALAERDAARVAAEGLATRYQTQNTAVSTSSRVRPLGDATVAEQSEPLTTVLYVVAGAVIGLVVGLLIALLRERSRPAMTTPGVRTNGISGNGVTSRQRRTAGAGA